MSDSASQNDPLPEPLAASVPSVENASPENLPPVEPPSGRFVMQLFLVPGLIVAAVIGVWALFGQLSSGEHDWRQLITELRSSNEHRRWRGAMALAQVLRADTELGASGQKLASNPQISQELANVMMELLKGSQDDKELVSQQSYVARTLGWLDTREIVTPALLEAMDAKHDPLVRSDAMKAVAMIAGRLNVAGKEFADEKVAERLIEVSQDSNPLLRQIAAYSLGLVVSDAADQRLQVMCEDKDINTGVNAGLGLVRKKHQAGIPVLVRMLQSSMTPVAPDKMEGETDAERRVRADAQSTMNDVAAINALKGARSMVTLLNAEQHAVLKELCEKIAKESKIPRARIEAEETLRALQSSKG
jgi:HEAT repeat protein